MRTAFKFVLLCDLLCCLQHVTAEVSNSSNLQTEILSRKKYTVTYKQVEPDKVPAENAT